MSTTAGALAATGGWSASLWVRRRAAVNGSALFAGDSPDSAESVSVKLETWKAESPDYRVGLSSRHRWDEPMGYSAPLDAWTHLVFVGDSSGTRLYADGVLVYTSSRVVDLPLRTIGAWFDSDDNPRDQWASPRIVETSSMRRRYVTSTTQVRSGVQGRCCADCPGDA